MSAGPGRGPIKATGSGWATWRRETDGDRRPTRFSLIASLVALVRGVPQFGAEFPGPGRLGSSSMHGSSPGFLLVSFPFLSGERATSILGPTRLVPEARFVEGDLLGEHVIDGPGQLGGQDA